MLKFFVFIVSLFGTNGALLYTSLGNNVTLPCYYDKSAKYLCWYKQVAGERPRIISSFYKHSPDSNFFYDQFKGDKRFSVHAGDGFYHLNISNVQNSDSAAYYCGHSSIIGTEFNYETFLVLKDSSCWSFLQQPTSDSVKPGGSVTLNCTVHTGARNGEHSVYWFKKDSRNSDLGVMYIHTQRSSQCVKSPESSAQSCVYSLSKRNVSLSDAGTYYCALASCAEVLLGKGTKLNVEEQRGDVISAALMTSVVAALFASVILNMILITIICKMSAIQGSHFAESQGRSSAPSSDKAVVYQITEHNVKLLLRSRGRGEETWSECVYHCTKQ